LVAGQGPVTYPLVTNVLLEVTLIFNLSRHFDWGQVESNWIVCRFDAQMALFQQLNGPARHRFAGGHLSRREFLAKNAVDRSG
jgi:hypothetical protein